MDMQAPDTTTPFADILLTTFDGTFPTNPSDTPETQARRLASAHQQFAAFDPADAAEAQLAAFAIATMQGAIDNLQQAARPGRGAETAARLRGNALAAGRFYASTLRDIRKVRQQAAAAAAQQPEPKPPPEQIPHIEVFQPRDRRGKPIPMWRNDLMTKKQKRAAYDFKNKAAWAIAAEEEEAAIAEQAKLDAEAGINPDEITELLPLRQPDLTIPPPLAALSREADQGQGLGG
jgi:hypothetical protein